MSIGVSVTAIHRLSAGPFSVSLGSDVICGCSRTVTVCVCEVFVFRSVSRSVWVRAEGLPR